MATISASTFSPEQANAFDLYTKGKNIFLTGPGGTGKSFLIKTMVEDAKTKGKALHVCALTGCAAVLLDCKATTVHSWSGIGMMNSDDDTIIRRISQKKDLKQHWKGTEILIVDEVSMMSKRMFELLNKIAKRIRGKDTPFGGMHVIFVGDFFQLPPIEKDGFCFESDAWFEVFPKEQHLELKTFFRQSDPVYIDILMKVRKGTLDKDSIAILEKYVARDRDQPITKVVPLRKHADFINQSMFDTIKEESHEFNADIRKDMTLYVKDGKSIELNVLALCNALNEKDKDRELESLMKNHNLCPCLSIKKGAQVMCIRNLDMDHQICNGSQGIVVDIVKDRPIVQFSNGHRMMMEKMWFQSEIYPTLAIGQYPLSLAWAVTIHKIQGCSLSHAQIDIGESIFEYGQTYVALSRVRTMDGLYLMNFQPKRIKSHPKVIAFYDSL
jgi:ATP-dependent DNA helicase PIF1